MGFEKISRVAVSAEKLPLSAIWGYAVDRHLEAENLIKKN
jgi:hypothetical protein